jgi:hypothetical protein
MTYPDWTSDMTSTNSKASLKGLADLVLRVVTGMDPGKLEEQFVIDSVEGDAG